VADSLYDQVGGTEFFGRLVDSFYDRVALDELLRPMYPDDLSEPRRHLALFLAQYWGGPTTYSDERGHPRLRLRHAPFAITSQARDAWLAAMTGALDSVGGELAAEQYAALFDYLDMTARQMRNV
jgi:hemoglobin